MPSDLNVVCLIGNLTKDPELRHTSGGTAVCALRIAVNTRAQVDGEWQDKPNYFDVIVWGNQGESAAQYLSKGRKVGINGRLQWREWESKEGQKRQTVEVVANQVQFLTPKSESEGSGSGEYSGEPGRTYNPQDDDIPF